MSRLRGMVALTAALTLPACERETREFRSATAEELALQLPSQTPYRVGIPPADSDRDARIALNDEEEQHYERNAHALSEGKWLFVRFNCHGCHGGGGGGDMGPPLTDAEWRYGHRPGQVLSSIIQGRPNGMPAFSSKVTRKQAWELAAYVRSMSGLGPDDSKSGREEHMKGAPPANSIDNGAPREIGPPVIPRIRVPDGSERTVP